MSDKIEEIGIENLPKNIKSKLVILFISGLILQVSISGSTGTIFAPTDETANQDQEVSSFNVSYTVSDAISISYGEETIEDGTANLYKFDYQVGKKYIKVFNLQYQESNDYYGREAGYRQGSVTAFIDKNTGEVYKPASWKSPAKHVRYDLRIIRHREFLHNPANTDWAGGHLYMR